MSRRRHLNNFWICKMHSYGVNFKKLSQIFDIPYSTLRSFVAGVIMPDNDVIAQFCKYFNVDYDHAYSAFLNIHRAWGEAHANTHVLVGNTYKPISQVKQKDPPKEITVTRSGKTPSVTECMKLLYGDMDYRDFISVLTLTTSYEELLRFSYGKVSYATFMRIWE